MLFSSFILHPSSLVPALLVVLCAPASRAIDAAERPAEHASERSRTVRRVLPASVRVQVLAGGEVRRTASGVVVQSNPASEGRSARSRILTNAHVADGSDLEGEISYRVLVERRGRVEKTLAARLGAMGSVPDLDLALLDVDELLPAAVLGREEAIDVGDDVVVVGAPYGRSLSVSGGMISLVEAEDGPPTAPRFKAMKTDASIGYGSSGGGVFAVPGGQLVGLVEGYRTARVQMGDGYAFDVPMPGETFVTPVTKIRAFLESHVTPPGVRPGAATAAAGTPAPAR